MKIRKPGCRTKIKPKDFNKIRIWLQVLEWYRDEKIGVKKIARRLNDMGIASPDAGRFRTDHGVVHAVTGKWSPATILALIRNQAIIGMQSYGVQSEGLFRRFGKEGPRLLDNSDIEQDKPKVIQNPSEVVMRYPSGVAACADKDLFDDCGKLLAVRGKSQRGISRRRDPARYPLAMKIFDMTGGCGHPVYALTSGNRPLYKCGRYLKTAGAECKHNTVDGEAALAFLVNVLRQQVDLLGGRDELRRRLTKLVEASQRAVPDEDEGGAIRQLQHRLLNAEAELNLVARNLARADGQPEYEAMRTEWRHQQSQVQDLRQQLQALKMKSSAPDRGEPAARIEQALSVYDNLQTVLKNPIARSKISDLLAKINVRLWLNFATNLKGTHQVQLLTGGIMTTGACEPPVQPYGADNSHGGRPSVALRGPNSSLEAVGVKETPPVVSCSQKEDVSLTMVNRGDKI
jgi:Recombinase